MDATVWARSQKKQLGIRVGSANRARYFSITWNHILVEMDGELRQFKITDGFWNCCPEFRDGHEAHLKTWLKQHGLIDWPKGKPPHVLLEPVEDNRFRLSEQ